MAKDVSARETSSVAWPAWVASWVAKATVSLASKPSGVATNDFKISSSAINFGDRPRRKMLVIDRALPGNEGNQVRLERLTYSVAGPGLSTTAASPGMRQFSSVSSGGVPQPP